MADRAHSTSRRALLAGLSVTPLLSVPVLGGAHPDAALLALAARYDEAHRAHAAASEALDACEAICAATKPARPDALRRAGDHRHFWGRASNPESPEFYTAEECRQFRGYVPGGHAQRRDHDAACARAAAIVAAFDAWRAEVAADEASHGLPDAEAREEAAYDLRQALRDEIAAARPLGLNGLVAKAQCWRFDWDYAFGRALRDDLLALGASA